MVRNPCYYRLLGLILIGLAGCQGTMPASRRPYVDGELLARTGQTLGPECCPGEVLLPECVALEDGVTAEEAVSVALWNNAGFQELLAGLDLSRAQFFNASLFPDPQIQMFFPIGVKQFEATAYNSLDVFWLRPYRMRAAERALDQLATQLIQNGLDVIRDTRLAHANLLLAQQQLAIAEETYKLRKELSRLAGKRNQGGAISELEAAAPEIEAIQAEANLAQLRASVEAAQAQLLIVMGLPEGGPPLSALGEECHPVVIPPAEELVAEALASRPDFLAASVAVEAAKARVKLAKKQWIVIDNVTDANSRGKKGFEIGPGRG